MLNKALEKLKEKEDIEVKEIILFRKNIEFCDGCLTCEDTGRCTKEDDMQEIYDEISRADGLIIATPIYFDSIPALLKNFIDRLNPLLVTNTLKGKKLGVLVVGQLSGEEGEISKKRVITYFKNLAEIFEMKFIGFVSATAREPGRVSSIEGIGDKCYKLGLKVIGD